MRKILMTGVVALTMAFSGAALAQTVDNSGIGNTINGGVRDNSTNTSNTATGGTGVGIGVGGQGGSSTANSNASATGGTAFGGVGVGMGGQGGQGGAGGNASATGGQGGSATALGVQGQQQGIVGSGNSDNTNRNSLSNNNDLSNRNSNLGVNLQGQQQGIDFDNAIKVGVGVDTSDVNNNTNRQGQGQDQGQQQGQGQDQGQSQGQSTENANNSSQNVTVEGDVYEAAEIPVATAVAAPLAAGANTCMGSTSGGIQTMDFGISVGSTWNDSKCDTRMDVATLMGMGLNDVAVARACQDSDMRAAIESAGKLCPGKTETAEEEAERVAAAPKSADGQVLKDDAPYWCKNTTSNNALWNQCVE